MARITVCMAYYLNPGMLDRQLSAFAALPPVVRDELRLIVVDDGSPSNPAEGRPIGMPLSIYRIEVDVRWNQDAARNVAARQADSRWLLLTDIDHLVPRGTFEGLLARKWEKTKAYKFGRMTLDEDGKAPVLTDYHSHPNSWFLTRDMYWRIGGYDERFAGHYGTDAEFRDRVQAKVLGIETLDKLKLWRVPRTTIADASTTTYTRKGDPIDAGAIARIKIQRAMEQEWKPRNLSFPYHLVGHWNR